MDTPDPFDELQTAVVAHSVRMSDFMNWADELQIQFRSLSARVLALEKCCARPADESDIDARLARFKNMCSISSGCSDGENGTKCKESESCTLHPGRV
jgi:hypothetical protein